MSWSYYLCKENEGVSLREVYFENGKPQVWTSPILIRDDKEDMLSDLEVIKKDILNNEILDKLPVNYIETQIRHTCEEIAELLVQKNKKYGNSALEPLGIFTNGDAITGLKYRIEDKLKRIKNMKNDDEDTLIDLIGYLILLKIALDNSGDKMSNEG